jgi:hypothetical protein
VRGDDLRERQPVPSLEQFTTITGTYVDNCTVIGRSFSLTQERGKAMQAGADHSRLPVTWSHPQPVKHLVSLGLELDIENKLLFNAPLRVWRTILAGEAILRRRRLHGAVMRS